MYLSESLLDRHMSDKSPDESPHMSSFISGTLNQSSAPSESGLVVVDDGNSTTVTSSGTLSTRWLPFQAEVLLYFFYGSLAITAVTSNMIVCYLVLSNPRMRTATNYFIVNLAVGDILMALLCIPFTVLSNYIFQYWPFGYSLCVIVSYSQAISVFISAYTMVAISIDKYLAIMYPLRPRMTKDQAKVIILVIWSAALLTSLPTAVLSRLIKLPSIYTSHNQTQSSNSSSQAQDSFHTDTLSLGSNLSTIITTPILIVNNEAQITNSPDKTVTKSVTAQETFNKTILESTIMPPQYELGYDSEIPTCTENWTSAEGKYYYSMALMILQYILPLLVLVITYTRIVIVVWGKTIPGEEDNVRDARIARSKRKMIKMVIFCVIAFALTWLPLNSLIVAADIYPVYDLPGAMYIFMCAHYLAMCHTITNPLIYIWMNNRFRAGFREVTGNICRLIKQWMSLGSLYCCWPIFVVACSMGSFEHYRDDLRNSQTKQKLLKSRNGIGSRSTVCINMTTTNCLSLKTADNNHNHNHNCNHNHHHHHHNHHCQANRAASMDEYRATCSASAAPSPTNYSQPTASASATFVADSKSLDDTARQEPGAANQFHLDGHKATLACQVRATVLPNANESEIGIGPGGVASHANASAANPSCARTSTAGFNYDSDYLDGDLSDRGYSRTSCNQQQQQSVHLRLKETPEGPKQQRKAAPIQGGHLFELGKQGQAANSDTAATTTTAPRGTSSSTGGARRQRRQVRESIQAIRIKIFRPARGERNSPGGRRASDLAKSAADDQMSPPVRLAGSLGAGLTDAATD